MPTGALERRVEDAEVQRAPLEPISHRATERHRDTQRDLGVSRRDGFGSVLYSANNDMTKPGVQKPHCDPW